MSHEVSIRLGELTAGERVWLLGWLNTAGNARSHIARGLRALDQMDEAERRPIAALDAVGDLDG